ncbi:hypothetical protein H1P_760025 [Hyella patelloides LEGE 07179]|uniref:Uncharacterized protein n=1 Tax=Hyella patelloides LEGE 07179 TaxID=945734 RepID=A0A563W3T6_9CYAN|nr:hypothetical protein H1P_760025 [Hyella patelloides LEGE 07179]
MFKTCLISFLGYAKSINVAIYDDMSDNELIYGKKSGFTHKNRDYHRH